MLMNIERITGKRTIEFLEGEDVEHFLKSENDADLLLAKADKENDIGIKINYLEKAARVYSFEENTCNKQLAIKQSLEKLGYIKKDYCIFAGFNRGQCGSCNKKNEKHICSLLGIEVREHQREGHPNDISCATCNILKGENSGS